jgi:hypothetical protein
VKPSHVDAFEKKCHAMPLNTLNKSGERSMPLLNEIIATVLLIVLAWFAAGSSQLADERSQIKRGNKWAKDNYPPTY